MRQIFVKTFELRSKVKRYIFQNTQCSEKHADNVGLYVGLILDKKITSYFNMKAPLKMPSGALNRLESGRRDTGIRGTSDGPNGLF